MLSGKDEGGGNPIRVEMGFQIFLKSRLQKKVAGVHFVMVTVHVGGGGL